MSADRHYICESINVLQDLEWKIKWFLATRTLSVPNLAVKRFLMYHVLTFLLIFALECDFIWLIWGYLVITVIVLFNDLAFNHCWTFSLSLFPISAYLNKIHLQDAGQDISITDFRSLMSTCSYLPLSQMKMILTFDYRAALLAEESFMVRITSSLCLVWGLTWHCLLSCSLLWPGLWLWPDWVYRSPAHVPPSAHCWTAPGTATCTTCTTREPNTHTPVSTISAAPTISAISTISTVSKN